MKKTGRLATGAEQKIQVSEESSKRIGPSGVRALPLAAGINEGGHYFRYFNLLLPPLFKTTEGVVVGFQIFA